VPRRSWRSDDLGLAHRAIDAGVLSEIAFCRQSPTFLPARGPDSLDVDVIIARMAAWSAVTVPRKLYEFPALCPDCLRTGPLTGVLIPANLHIEVPFCEPCAARQLKRRKLGRPLTILAVVVAFAVMLWFDLSKWEGCFLAVVLALPTVWLTDYRGRVVRVKSYDADKVTFEFKRSEYAQQFVNLHKVASGVAAK
jgi:hypothetical protein